MPETTADARGLNQAGKQDENRLPAVRGLPPVRPNYRATDTNERIRRLLRSDKPRHRTETYFPYLIIRAAAGDTGARPLPPSTASWESCDIHLLPATETTFDLSKTVLGPIVGETYKVYVHVWNLGRFAAYGARLRVWWLVPGFFNGTTTATYQPRYVGGAFYSLGDRDSGDAHRFIEVTTPWTVTGANGLAHQGLIAAVDCATDPWDGLMHATTHRHVAQRNLSLISAATDDRLGSIVGLERLVSHLAVMMSENRNQEMLISSVAVSHSGLAGAQQRGLSSSSDPAGWNHTGDLQIGGDARPLVAVRRTPTGLRAFDITTLGRLPLPGSTASSGQLIVNPRSEIPNFLAGVLGISRLTSHEVLGTTGEPRALRFVATDSAGNKGGHTIIVAP